MTVTLGSLAGLKLSDLSVVSQVLINEIQTNLPKGAMAIDQMRSLIELNHELSRRIAHQSRTLAEMAILIDEDHADETATQLRDRILARFEDRK